MNYDKSKGDAIVSVSSDGSAKIIMWLIDEGRKGEYWKIDANQQFDDLGEYVFSETPGLYYAKCVGYSCGGTTCKGYPCAGDCFQVDWEIIGTLFVLGGEK